MDVSVPQARVRVDSASGEAREVPTARLLPRASVSAFASTPVGQKSVQLGTIEPPFQALFKHWSKPAAVACALGVCVVVFSQPLTLAYWALVLVGVLLSRQIFTPLPLRATNAPHITIRRVTRLIVEWSVVSGLLLFLGHAFGLTHLFPRRLIVGWLTLTPIMLLVGELVAVRLAVRSASRTHRHIIIGATEVGLELARRVEASVGSGTFMGFFDFRRPERLPQQSRERFAGACKDVAAFVQRHAINAIYIALPMRNELRMEGLLNACRDTTASIYFVPDLFAFETVQARCVEMNGIPLLSICDTPFHGMAAVNKRAIDLALSSFALVLALPLMAAAAIAVKLSSPGPVLFKQRRYGLDGEEILVYKFRSMTVCEDGPVVEQAKPSDKRVTAVGRFLRRTSLDELPQLFNVLQGKMSFVGPRPHAVVHNELYRKLISGYMIRHKVRPGMTGWAQVHGLRGETTTVEQMRLRVQYDLDYLQNWSPWLDARILAKTALIVLHGSNAH
jgi:putative colanic acid biosynthesis UDP-glucose lipid carrier transferase